MQAGDELAGRYRLAGLLGHGAMGEVWRATDLNLERDVAVKVITANWIGEAMKEALARFRREGKAAARLNHPCIADVYDLGDHQGKPFLVLELLTGPDLATLLRRHPDGLPVKQALEYGAQAAEGLAVAHAAGIVHRDVKPSNLILDRQGTVKVCDFGIARLDGATAGLTGTGTALGTPNYMSPEQARAEAVTAASDVYGLGATLFHLLTGQVVFHCEDVLSVLYQHVNQLPPAASDLRARIPAEVDAYLRALLAKSPADRPSTDAIASRLRTLSITSCDATALLAEAEDRARTITDPDHKAHVLRETAAALVRIDLSQARAVLAEAERIARSITSSPYNRARALRKIAGVLAEIDPAQAEDLARSITDPYNQARALSKIAEALAGTDPGRALVAVGEAERIARTFTEFQRNRQEEILGEIAAALTRIDPGRARALLAEAERIAHGLNTTDIHETIGRALARIDPAAAEHFARTYTDSHYGQARVLQAVAKVLAETDPSRAQAVLGEAARNTPKPDHVIFADVLRNIAGVMAGINPDWARSMLAKTEPALRGHTDAYTQALKLGEFAEVLALLDPGRARVVLAEAEYLARTINTTTTPHNQMRALRKIAVVLCRIDPAQAEQLARTIPDPYNQARGLVSIAREITK
jgi:serine/threonine protein kinase